jgi:hypothetical protein
MMKWVFGADTTPFRKGLDDMRTQTKAFAGSVKGMLAGAIGVGSIVAGLKTVVEYFSRISDLATRFGESAESMQRVGAAAQQAGSDLEGVAKAMTIVTKNANTAATQGGSMAEAFAALGIDVSGFVNMPIEDKLLTLAKAMDNGKGSGQNLAQMMQVLGKSGAEMIPLLSQGFEELQEQMKNTSVLSESTVATIEQFGDGMDDLKQKSMVLGGYVFQFFDMLGKGIGGLLNFVIRGWMEAFSLLADSSMESASIMKKLFTGDFQGAAQGVNNLKKNFQTSFDQIVENAHGFVSDLDYALAGGKTGKKGSSADVEMLAEMAQQEEERSKIAEKTEEDRKKLAEEIAKLKEDAAFNELKLAEQILALETKSEEMRKKAYKTVGNQSLEAQKEMLETEKELKKLREDQGKIQQTANQKAKELADKAKAEEAKKAEELAELRKDEEKQIRDVKFEGLKTDEEKVAMLAKEQSDLLKKAQKAKTEEDKINLRMEARDKGSEIAAILADKKENVLPTLSTSSLASIGGGGSANILAAGTQKIDRQISLLEVIARNTAKSEGGGIKIPDPI